MKERLTCRLCGGKVHKVFSLAPSPIANSFPLKPDSKAKRYPMDLMSCKDCEHVQQRYVLSGLFDDYKYQTPQTWHLEKYASELAKTYKGRVLEIGCNNGAFLDRLIAAGFDAEGIDPAADHPKAVRAFFTSASAGRFKPVDLIVANNVLAHIDNLLDVFSGIVRILKPDGALVFEVQYLPDLLKAGAFDLMYHEHLDMHHLKPLQPFLRLFGLVMTEWKHLATHGGSIRVTAKFKGKECSIPEEKLDWLAFAKGIEGAQKRLKTQGQMVAFGAAAKACTLINELGIAKQINYCVDDTPGKWFRYIPGTDIQIFPVSKLGNEKVLMTAWNYEREIRSRIKNELVHPFSG